MFTGLGCLILLGITIAHGSILHVVLEANWLAALSDNDHILPMAFIGLMLTLMVFSLKVDGKAQDR